MTIVDISDLDTFVRDSLFNVRKGIANSRNTTQSNPLLGVMVDLPDKIDFEIVVTSGYQSLDRISSSIESRKDIDAVVSKNNTADLSLENEISSSSETTSDSSLGSGNEIDTKNGSGSELDNKTGVGNELDNKTGVGNEMDKKDGIGKEEDKKNGNGIKTDQSKSKQDEIHKEANDRASSTFDEEDGTWGGQGQVSNPQLLGGPACTC